MGVTAAIIGAVGAVAGTYSSVKAGQEQAAAANKQAEYIKAQNAETARKLALQQEQQNASNRARIAASGIDASSGSSQLWMSEQLSQQKSDIEWLKKSGTLQSDYLTTQASAYQTQGMWGGAGTLLGGLSSSYINYLKS